MSEADYGEYQCTATNVVGSSVCTIELSAGMITFSFLKIQISPLRNRDIKKRFLITGVDAEAHPDAGVDVGVIVAAVLGALLGCLLIGLLVWFIVHTVNKGKYNAVQTGGGNEMR